MAIDKRCIYGDLLRQADSGADALSFLLPPAQEQTLDCAASPSAQGSAEFGDGFERMPSQQTRGDSQDRLEAIVQPELAKVGLQRDDAAALYSVAFELRFARDPRAPWDDPPYWGGLYRGVIVTPTGTVVHVPMLPMQFDVP